MTPLRGNIIAGEEIIDPARQQFERRNPADERQTLTAHALAEPQDVDAAVEAARSAQTTWASLPGPRRGEILHRAATLLEGDAEQAALEIAEHAGKTLADARAEVFRTGTLLRYFGEQARAADGEIGDAEEAGTSIFTRREPLGLIALITPWNFPLAIPARKLAPALAFGNTAILKPSPLAAAPALRLAQLLHTAGLPAGCLGVLVADADTSQALTGHRSVDAVSFTGSTIVGQQILKQVANRVPVQAEMGGHNPIVILRDADPRKAAEIIAHGAFNAAGQTCTATRRIIVERQIRPTLLPELIEITKHLRLGPGTDPATNIPPLIASQRRTAVEDELAAATNEGATITEGGTRPGDTLAHGAYLHPTILDNVTPNMRIASHEVFGPVASIIDADDFEHALEFANAGGYGLSSAIVTNDLAKAVAFARSATSGMVHINRPTVGSDPQMPFGGTRASSHGPAEQGVEARHFYTHTKTVYLHAT